MVRVPCVIQHKVESCSDKHYNDCWYSVFSSSGTEKRRHQGVVSILLCFYIDQYDSDSMPVKINNDVRYLSNFWDEALKFRNRGLSRAMSNT